MKARAAESVFWPGIVGDITRTRWECLECNKMAKSNPQGPPHPPPEPEFPFQLLAADYFQFGGKNYVVVVDRYSNWPVVFSAENGAHGLIKVLRDIFATFGVAEEIASDGAKEFTADSTQQFLKDWCVRHRISSVAYPHSNCRAELGVKQVKRIITGNISPSGSLNVDSFQRAILSYRNTIDPVTKFSPALALFGRQIRDGLPILKGKYNPHQTWKELLEHREKALAKRHVLKHEAWSEHTRQLCPPSVGDKVFIQNQVGNHPRRWERTGVIVEVKDHDQYSVRVDGTGRLTLRNRKFLRLYQPINRGYSQEKKPMADPTPNQFNHVYSPAPTDDRQDPDIIPAPADDNTSVYIPAQTVENGPDHSNTLPDEDHATTSAPPCETTTKIPAPTERSAPPPETPIQTAPRTPPDAPRTPNDAPRRRTQRAGKPNPKYSSELWDLSPVHYVQGYIPRGW